MLPPVYSPIGFGVLARALRDQARRGGASIDQPPLASDLCSETVYLTASGSQALRLALSISMRPGVRGVVALPAFCCPDVGAAAIAAGYRVLLYDIVPDTLNPDIGSLRAALEAGATHVVAVHLYGVGVNVSAMSTLCEAYGAVLIEDAAQAAGATVGGQRAGSLASIGILSFGRGKGINAGGGGAIILKEPWASRDIDPLPVPSAGASLAQLFQVVLTQLLSHPAVYAIPSAVPWLGIGKTVYKPVPAPTGASRTTHLLLPTAERINYASLSHRRALANGYATRLSGIPGIGLVRTAWEESGALRFPVQLGFQPAEHLQRLGVVRSYPRTLIEYAPVRGALASERISLPGAELLARSLYTLPTHIRCSEAQAGRIVQELIEEARTAAGQQLNADS